MNCVLCRYAAEHGVIIVNPDTSPRGVNIPGDSDCWDFGVAAGFYVDATEKPWSNHYRMFSYVTSELINIVNSNFPVIVGKQSIMGHRYFIQSNANNSIIMIIIVVTVWEVMGH